MKMIFLSIFVLFSSILFGQDKSSIKIDTLFFSGKVPKLDESKMMFLLRDVINTCDPSQEELVDDRIESNREFRTVSNLMLFNKQSRTTIFTEADALIISYFCQNIDYVNEIEFYEFIFENDELAKLLIEKLIFLHNKKGFNDYIGFKNWFYKRIGAKVYFIDYKEENMKNTIIDKLKINLKSINE